MNFKTRMILAHLAGAIGAGFAAEAAAQIVLPARIASKISILTAGLGGLLGWIAFTRWTHAAVEHGEFIAWRSIESGDPRGMSPAVMPPSQGSVDRTIEEMNRRMIDY